MHAKHRERAVDVELRRVPEQLLRSCDLIADLAPQALALLAAKRRNAAAREPRIQLAGEEHLLAVAERDAEDGTAAAVGAEHVNDRRLRCAHGVMRIGHGQL